MPSSVGPNTFGEENLVFGYDLGDVSNSYKGEPTTNTAVIDNYYTYWNNSGTATWSNNDTTIPRLFPDLPVMSMYKLTDGNSHLGLGYSNQVTTSTEYTYSVYVWIPSSNSAGMAGSVPYFRPQPANYGAVTLSYNGSTSWGTWPRDQWIRISGTATTQATNVTNAYISCYLNTTGDKIFFTAPQMEQKGHSTPFTRTSRSTIQGLIDLTGNSTIDLTNVSFDSNAQMTFDGTNDKIHGVSTTLSYLSSSAFEFVVTPESTGVRMMVGGYRHNEGYSSPTIGAVYIENDNKFYASVITAAEVYRYVQSTTTTSTNQTYHVVFNKDTVAGVMQLYINGTLESTTTFNAATYGQWSSAGNYIGSNNLDFGKSFNTNSGQGWSGDFLDGKIHSIKLYSRTLTASEVASNYKAIKGRFNI